MTFAVLILAQTIALVPPAGVWFPPAGRPSDYLDGRRSYSKDLKEAFADPKVMAAVCGALPAAPRPGAGVDARLRQMRMTLDMACVAGRTNERDRPAGEARQTSIDANLGALFDDAAKFAATIPAGDRKAAQRALLGKIDAMTEAGPDRLEAIVRTIILRPQDARGAWMLMRAGIETKMSGRELEVYVERLYRTQAAATGREAPDWESGLREVLIYVGKDEEARRLTELRNDPHNDYDRMLLAFVEEMHEPSGGIARAVKSCKDAQFCRDVVWSMATRTARIRAQLTPPAVAQILEPMIPWYEDNWPMRLDTARVLASIDPARGRKAVTAMYLSPDIPSGAVLDAMQIDASVAFAEKNHLRSIALRDCWLQRRKLAAPPLPHDAWIRFVAIEEPQTKNPQDGCHGAPETPAAILSDCTTRTLVQRLHDAMYIREWELSKQSVEMLVAYTLASHIAPTIARNALVDLAGVMTREGDPSEAARIVRYLDRQPLSAAAKYKLSDFRKRLPQSQEVTLEPWDRLAGNPAAKLPNVCGK